MTSAPQASTILALLGQAAFVWDIATDQIIWSDHAASVFGDIAPEAFASGAELAKLIEPVRSIRTDALSPSPLARSGDGAPYRIEYGVRASTSLPVLWIEESGTWFAGPDGKPARAQGIVRLNNERHGLRRTFADFFEDYDILLCPVGASAAPPHNHEGETWQRTITVNGKSLPSTNHLFWAGYATLVFLPATTGPLGTIGSGLPVGYQAIAASGRDRTAIAFSRAVETEIGGFVPPPGFD